MFPNVSGGNGPLCLSAGASGRNAGFRPELEGVEFGGWGGGGGGAGVGVGVDRTISPHSIQIYGQDGGAPCQGSRRTALGAKANV